MRVERYAALLLVLGAAAQSALADVCDHRPSKVLGEPTTTVVAGGAGTVAVAGIGMKAAGIYAITHSVTGAAMLGSTAAGASAAGTMGIIAGTAGALGTVGGVLLSPFVFVPAAVLAVGVGAYEGGCYWRTKQVASESAGKTPAPPGKK